MNAVRFHEFGDPSVLRYEDVERPVPAAGQVLVEVAAMSFNAVDAGIRAGYLREVFPVALPHTPGIDVAAAEFVVASADALVNAPASLPLAWSARPFRPWRSPRGRRCSSTRT
ncbi:hypothetical protein AB0E59_32075 [Lentzea sp. NPDC034063]|uniref:hypothetical protein n=1 Tax=unclassified Lentzea TaxID=2643253 RepID=UPI0033EE62BF